MEFFGTYLTRGCGVLFGDLEFLQSVNPPKLIQVNGTPQTLQVFYRLMEGQGDQVEGHSEEAVVELRGQVRILRLIVLALG